MKRITHFFGRAIAVLLLLPAIGYGQIYNMPAGTTVTCSGNFYDPGGSAANYSDAAPTIYLSTITAQSGDQLFIQFANVPPTFKNVFLETNDFLNVYDGPTTASPLIGSYTGVMSVPEIRSTGSSVTLELVTNGNGVADAGFRVSIQCITMPDGSYNLSNSATPIVIGCNTRNDFYDPAGFMAQYPSTGATYTSTYTTSSGLPMLVNVSMFSTHFRDTLFIYDGNSTSAPLIAALKGFVTPFNFNTTSDAITFSFKENGDGFSGHGWFITATCVREETIACGAPVIFHDPAGSTKNYKTSFGGERFMTTYTCPPGQFLEAIVTNFSTSYQFIRSLQVYDGPDISSPLIGTFSGTGFNSFNVSSSGNSLTFYVNTHINSFWDFNFDVTFNCTSTQQPTTFTVGGSTSPMSIPCGVTSQIIDLGGNTWAPENHNIPSPHVQTYTVPAGQFIKLEFTELNLSDIGDRLNVYDGATTTDPLIASYTSTNNPSNRNPKPPITLTSSSNVITVEIITDMDFLFYQGFEAEMSCISAREGSNFSLGNSTQPVSVLCGTSSTFEDLFGASYYIDNAIQEYVTTYFEGDVNPMYFAFRDFHIAAGDTLFVYDGSSTLDPLIGKYSGTLAPFSVGGIGPITFQFKTNGIDNSFTRGWYAEISCNDLLPVEWINFIAVGEDDKVKLEWSTASENSNHYFVVEKSEDGLDFIALDTVGGAGVSVAQSDYSYIDIKPYEFISYYRIKQVDFDRSSSYSQIRAVNRNEMGIRIYPQPAYDNVTIAISNSEYSEVKIQLIDKVGKTVYEKITTENNNKTIQVDLSGLPEDLYFLIVTEGANTLTQKFFKRN